MKSLLDRYMTGRIDRALDDARPLDAPTAWYVRRNPALWDYYATMLALEIELRFPSSEHPDEPPFRPPTASPKRSGASPEYRSASKATYSAMRTASVVAVLSAVVMLAFWLRSTAPTPEPQPSRIAADAKIDPAELFALSDSLRQVVRSEIVPSFPIGPSAPNPVESIVAFAERPLSSTLSLLETIGVLESFPLADAPSRTN